MAKRAKKVNKPVKVSKKVLKEVESTPIEAVVERTVIEPVVSPDLPTSCRGYDVSGTFAKKNHLKPVMTLCGGIWKKLGTLRGRKLIRKGL